MEAALYLDGVICVVDGKHVLEQVRKPPSSNGVINECQQQIAFSDSILLNKCDLISLEKQDEIESEIRAINQMANISRTIMSSVDIDKVLHIEAFDEKRQRQLLLEQQQHHHHHHDCGDDCHEHQHYSFDVVTLNYTFECDLDLQKLRVFLSQLLWNEDADYSILRMKAIFNVASSPFKYTLQCVRELWTLDETSLKWPDNEKRLNKVIFIGTHLKGPQWIESIKKL